MAADNSLLRSHLRELLSELCNKFEQFTNSQDSWPPDHVTVRIAAASLAALGHRPAGMALLTEYNRLTFDLVGHTAAQIIERTPKSRRAAERRQWQQLIGEIPSYDRLPKNVREDRDLIIRGQAARLGKLVSALLRNLTDRQSASVVTITKKALRSGLEISATELRKRLASGEIAIIHKVTAQRVEINLGQFTEHQQDAIRKMAKLPPRD